MPRLHRPGRSLEPSARRGAALPAVLVVMFWLTGVTGWLIAHAIWDQRITSVDDDIGMLARAADAMSEVMVLEVGRVADWTDLVTPGPPMPCPVPSPPSPPYVSIAAETTRLQTATDGVSRWAPAVRPVWRFVALCDVGALQGTWRGQDEAPWALAWTVDDPEAPAGGVPPVQVVVHVVALRPGGRAARTLTVRRTPAPAGARIVAWRPG